jgi:spore coat protein CotH
VLDIDGALKFLALDNAAVNNDGYWTRASDFAIYRDPNMVFHVIPQDINETFSPARAGLAVEGRESGWTPSQDRTNRFTACCRRRPFAGVRHRKTIT